MSKNAFQKMLISVSLLTVLVFFVPTVNAWQTGDQGSGGGNSGGGMNTLSNAGSKWVTGAYKFSLVYRPKGEDYSELECAVVNSGKHSDYFGQYDSNGKKAKAYAQKAGCVYIDRGLLSDLAEKLYKGASLDNMTIDVETARKYTKYFGIDPNSLSEPGSEPGNINSYGYRILIQELQCFGLGASWIPSGQDWCPVIYPRKEVAQWSSFSGYLFGSSYNGDLYTTQNDIGIWNSGLKGYGSNPWAHFNPPLGKGNELNSKFGNWHDGTGFNIIGFPPEFGRSYNYSIDAACENCNNTLDESNGSYYIQDTTNWEAIKKSVDNKESSNVPTYYTKGGNVVCREEYKVTFPNATNNIMVKNGQYFTFGLVAPQMGHPNFAPVKVKRIMQCQDINGGKTAALQNFANKKLKSAGTVSLNYIEGSTVDKLLTKNSKGVYNIKAGDYAGDDYSYKTASIKESITSQKTTWSGNTATLEIESNYLLPDDLYRYIKKNGKSMQKKPTSNIESYTDSKTANLPISFEDKVKQWDDLAAAVKLSYKLPTDNSKMHEAWDEGNKAYFGDKNTAKKQNIYVNDVTDERKDQTACAKLYGYNTSGYKECAAKRTSDKMGDCKSVNKNDYVCPIRSYQSPPTEDIEYCHKITTKKNKCEVKYIGKKAEIQDCSQINAGECVYNVSCEPISGNKCQINDDGEIKNISCTDAYDLGYKECPYSSTTNPKRCQSLDDFKSCELQEFKDGEWRYIANSRKNCSFYASKYTECPQGPETKITDLIYRPIDLTIPFPGMRGVGRESGDNWCDSSGNCTKDTSYSIKTNITNNRGKEGEDVYGLTPMYSFQLNGAKIREIKRYNKYHDYSDFTLDCQKDGTACISNFIRKYSSGTSTCNGSRSKTNFYGCKYGQNK